MGPLDARCFDTNIVIDWLNGIEVAGAELRAVGSRVISVVTWIEVLAGVQAGDVAVRQFVSRQFEVVRLDEPIAERALELRRSRRIKLPDAIIHATALHRGVQLVTRNTKDFSPDDPTIRVPYQL